MGVRKGDWKFLPYSGERHADSTKTPELFNLKKDISETKNIYDLYPEIVEELTRIIESNYHDKK